MRITQVESYRIQLPAADPPFAWRQGLRGGPLAGEGAVLRIGTRPELALAMVLAVAPVLIVFLFSQRALVSGMLAGATKE